MTGRSARTIALPGAAAVALALAVGSASCRDQTTQPQPGATTAPEQPGAAQVPQTRGNPYAYVGREHNQALDHVLRELQVAARRQGPLTKQEALRIAEATLQKVFRNHLPGRDVSDDLRWWSEFLRDRQNASARELGATMDLQSAGTLSGDIVVSSRGWDYLNQILYLADIAGSVAELQQSLAGLEAAASGELASQDLEAVYVVSSVAASSAEYWDANYSTWEALCTDSPDLCGGSTALLSLSSDGDVVSLRINGWKVLAADVLGAIGGFLLGGPVNAVVAAAVGSSVSVISQM